MELLHLCLSKESHSKRLVKVKTSLHYRNIYYKITELGLKYSLNLVFQDVKAEILRQLQSYNKLVVDEDRKDSPFAMVLDGKALELCLSSDVRKHFLSVAMSCDVVICCRVSPKQKALVGHISWKISF